MNDLEINFESESENGNNVFVTAIFEPIHDFEETQYGERSIFYWHLIDIKIKHSKCPHMFFGCGCYEANESEYNEFETEAIRLASQEAA